MILFQWTNMWKENKIILKKLIFNKFNVKNKRKKRLLLITQGNNDILGHYQIRVYKKSPAPVTQRQGHVWRDASVGK
jgi:hypothetical protein